jgi:hypothetical protein
MKVLELLAAVRENASAFQLLPRSLLTTLRTISRPPGAFERRWRGRKAWLSIAGQAGLTHSG